MSILAKSLLKVRLPWHTRCTQISGRNISSQLFDPPYLESMKPKISLYGPLNIQITGFDFVLLESYQKVINKVASIMDVNISDGWATPAKTEKIHKFKPNSSTVNDEYVLSTYERNIQVVELPVNVAPIFFEMIQAALPQGVSFNVHEHLEADETVRYVPDLELKELKNLLESLGGPVTKKK